MGDIFTIRKDGNAISSIILFKFKDRVSAEFAASDEKFRDMSPNHYLFWEAIKLAYAEEYKIFDFGRTSPLNKSLMDFKMRWGTEVVDLPQFFYPKEACLQISKMEESGRYKLAKYLTAKAPDFTQQLIGKFFYCHLG